MPSILRIEPDEELSNFFKLVHGYNKRFVDYLRLGLKPLTCRKYDAASRVWSVHISRLPHVVSFGIRYFDHVDYDNLTSEIKSIIEKSLNDWNTYENKYSAGKSLKKVDPYFTLCVTSHAPWAVIKAAYTALVQMHHPDKGGDANKFIEIQKAYEELKKKKRH